MSDALRKTLDQIAERDQKSTITREHDSVSIASLFSAAESQADVAVLLGIVNAALTVLDDYDLPDRSEDTTGEALNHMERLENSVIDAMERAATTPMTQEEILMTTDEIRERIQAARDASDRAVEYHNTELLYETGELEDPYDGTFLAGITVNDKFIEREQVPEDFFVAAVEAIKAAPAQVAALETVLEVLDSIKANTAAIETPSEYTRGFTEAANRLELALSAKPKPVVIYYPDSTDKDGDHFL